MKRSVALGGGLAGAALGYALVVRGALTLDLGIGRRVRPLGPVRVEIAAPPEVVFRVVTDPYLGRTPRAMADKLDVIERGSDMVLAAHFTEIGRGLTATTVETVRFEAPRRISFRLLRGPVPYVVESFELRPAGSATELEYRGELGTDLWGLGAGWGALVARRWVRAVEESLAGIAAESKRRAAPRAPGD
jgi:Polyketide cyclase / dehydrase and lipid transport